ncbi:MAG: IPT/TIG domain-containing protein [Acidimicrobiales bacterium]|jgi:virginiamycin B lyase
MLSTRYAVALIVLLSFVGLTLTASPATAKGNTGGVVVTDYPVPTQFADPSGIVTGPDGALWFTDSGLAGSIGRMTTAGVLTTYTDPSINRPQQITVGPDGALWFTNFNSNTIGRITTTGAVTSYTTPGLSLPYEITAGSDGALWFTYLGGIGRITTAGVITNLYPVPGIDLLNGLTTTADGGLWFIAGGSGENVERMNTSGVVTNSYTFYNPGSFDDIATGSDGALWLTSRTGNLGLVARVTTDGVISTYPIGHVIPTAITSGPDGALWVLAGSTKVLGDYSVVRLTTSGVLSSYQGPGLTGPQFITAGPDGALWFTDQDSNHLGSIGRASVPTPTVTGISPAAAVVGHKVHINGVDLSNATSVTFNGIPATIGVDKDTEINTTVPPGATSGPVVVATPDGIATGDFVVPLPTISGLSPATGAAGATVQIRGANLLNATVEFNGTLATIVSDGATKIVTNVPSGAETGPVTVTTPDGTAMSSFVIS